MKDNEDRNWNDMSLEEKIMLFLVAVLLLIIALIQYQYVVCSVLTR